MKWLNLKGSNQISHKNISYTLSYAKLKALNEQYQDISDQWLMALGMCSLRSEINYPGQSTIQICISYLALQEDQIMRTESESVSMGWYNPQWCQDLHFTAGTAREASTNVRSGMAGARGAGWFGAGFVPRVGRCALWVLSHAWWAQFQPLMPWGKLHYGVCHQSHPAPENTGCAARQPSCSHCWEALSITTL